MSASPELLTDGSSVVDARRVEVDRDDQPYRWRCPNGHTTWSKTNSHIWCPSCARSSDPDVEPEHWELRDEKTGETVSYAAVDMV